MKKLLLIASLALCGCAAVSRPPPDIFREVRGIQTDIPLQCDYYCWKRVGRINSKYGKKDHRDNDK